MMHGLGFDPHQFYTRAQAVSASSRISFEDYRAGMHIDGRVVARDRRLPTPAFALRDNLLREAVLTYCERRLYLPHTGTQDERRARIDATANAVADAKREQLANLLRAYATTRSAAHRGAWETQIQNMDSDLVLDARGLCAVVLSVAYLYWRTHWDSPDIATHLCLQNEHVRQLLARLSHMWEKREAGELRTYRGGPRRCGKGARKLLKRARISARLKGRTFDDAWRAKLSAAARRRTPEWRAAKSAAMKAAWARGVYGSKRHVAPEVTGGSR